MLALVRIALQRPYTFVVMGMLICIFGVMSWVRTPTDIFPAIRIPVASALVFDIGVFALVVGATLLMLVALAHQSVRGRRATSRALAAPTRAARLPVAVGED